MAYFRLAEVVAILELALSVAEGRRKAFRERLNFIFRSTTILNGDHERPGRDRHDFHSFHRVATTLALMMVGLRVERCHHVVAPRWNKWLALLWAIAWLEAADRTQSRPLMVVGDDAGLEFAAGGKHALIVRLLPWHAASDPAWTISSSQIGAELHAYRVLDLLEFAKALRSILSQRYPSILAAFEKEARHILSQDSFWVGAFSDGKAGSDLDDDSPVALSPDIQVDIAYAHGMSRVALLSRLSDLRRRA
jgi:hypothetical protein